MIKNKSKIILFIISLLIFSCQKVEILDPIVFDYNQFTKLSINAEKKNTIKNTLSDNLMIDPH